MIVCGGDDSAPNNSIRPTEVTMQAETREIAEATRQMNRELFQHCIRCTADIRRRIDYSVEMARPENDRRQPARKYMPITHKVQTKNGVETVALTPIKACRLKCLECSNWSSHEVKTCHIKDCALYPFRMGKNPGIKQREYTDEQRQAMAERMRSIRKQ